LLLSPHASIYAVKTGLGGAKRRSGSVCPGFVSVTRPPNRARYRTQISGMAVFTIVLRTRRKDDRGRAPVRLRIAHRGTKRFIRLGLKAEVEKWDSGKERVRRSHPDAGEINAFLSELETTALSVLSELNRAGKMLTADRIKDTIQERRGASRDAPEDFLAFAREQLEGYRGVRAARDLPGLHDVLTHQGLHRGDVRR